MILRNEKTKQAMGYIVCLLLGVFIGLAGWFSGSPPYGMCEQDNVEIKSLPDTVQNLQKSYSKFKSMSGSQLHDVWSKLFFYSEYKIDGKVRKNEFDCSGGETTFWKILGANVQYEDTTMKEARLKRISKPRRLIKDVQVGDIIIFRRIKGSGHIAVVEHVNKTKLRYMDLNIIENGQGFNTILFRSSKIQGVYPMSFAYWCGDILK